MPPSVDALDHLVLTVADIDRSVAFYTAVLGMRAAPFQPAEGPERMALEFGTQKINLHPADAPFAPHAHAPQAGSGDLCFLSSTDLNAWQAHLDQSGVAIEEGPVRRSGATGPILSLYIRDPDGNLIELSNPAS